MINYRNSIITFTDDSSTTVDIHLGTALAINGGEGIDATISAQISIAGELQQLQIKVSASFSSDNFTVSSN